MSVPYALSALLARLFAYLLYALLKEAGEFTDDRAGGDVVGLLLCGGCSRASKPLGLYMADIFEGRPSALRRARECERASPACAASIRGADELEHTPVPAAVPRSGGPLALTPLIAGRALLSAHPSEVPRSSRRARPSTTAVSSIPTPSGRLSGSPP